MSAESRKPVRERRETGERLVQHCRREKVFGDVKSSADGFVAIQWLLGSDDFTPAFEPARIETNEEDQSRIDFPEARLERLDER